MAQDVFVEALDELRLELLVVSCYARLENGLVPPLRRPRGSGTFPRQLPVLVPQRRRDVRDVDVDAVVRASTENDPRL